VTLGLALPLLAKRPWPRLMAVSLSGWMVILGLGRVIVVPDICGALAGAWLDAGWWRLEIVLLLNPPVLLASSWVLMLMAMMPPLLAKPVMHLQVRSLSRCRGRAVVVFAMAYTLVWMAAGVVLLAAAAALRIAVGGGEGVALALAAAIAVAWQIAPARRRTLERCHRLPRLSAFGLAADRDCLLYGLRLGLWCVGACWALMLLPLVGGTAHALLMAAVSVLLAVEPAPPGFWRRFPWPVLEPSHLQGGRG
jgi:predicted metal-binding membrane protein